MRIKEKDLKEIYNYINNVSDNIKEEIETKIAPMKKQAKKMVKGDLYKGHGVDMGIYKKHIIINNLDKNIGQIYFQVGASKGHHRLTHLLENGHRIVSHGKDTGKRTKKVSHIKEAQDYVDKTAISLCKQAINKAFEKKG